MFKALGPGKSNEHTPWILPARPTPTTKPHTRQMTVTNTRSLLDVTTSAVSLSI